LIKSFEESVIVEWAIKIIDKHMWIILFISPDLLLSLSIAEK
jgi:hypothetical protein